MKEFKYDLSIGLIVKNEEEVLERCLKSLEVLTKELKTQIIITDTGSSDDTVEIAKKYADELICFEWCNNFSIARNTGVNKALGRWFMFIDADEFFDESCVEIVKFLKSNDSKKYNQASIKRRDYKKEMNDFIDCLLSRLFNFEKGQREFVGAIHEGIPVDGTIFTINAILHHDGYLKEKSLLKSKRNEELLREAIKENPKDLRSYLQIINSTEQDVKKLSEIDLMIKSAIDNKMENSDYFYIALYEKVAILNKLGNYSLALDIASKYIAKFNSKTVLYQNIVFEIIKALENMGEYEKAIEEIKEYQRVCLYLNKNPDNYFPLIQIFNTNHSKEYYKSFLKLSDISHKLGKNAKENLSNDIALYKENTDYPLLLEFIINACNIQAFDLITSLYKKASKDKEERIAVIKAIENVLKSAKYTSLEIDIINALSSDFDGYTLLLNLRKSEYTAENIRLDKLLKDELLYKSEYFLDALYFEIKNLSNQFDFINSYKKDMIDFAFTSLSGEKHDFKKLAYEYLIRVDFSKITKLKEVYFYKTLAYNALISKSEMIEDESLDLFELFLSLSNEYNQVVYKEELNIDDLALINKIDAVAYILFSAYINKENTNEFVLALKEAINLDENLIDISKIILSKLEKDMKAKNESQNEFSALGNQIKVQVKNLIKAGKNSEALMILQQYEKINPNDSEIKELYKILG